ncbi:hypothetical protein GCM10008983_10520 [Lentibacillus halophilus]|uniref:Uncharacterized protein n=1 Tax=Lentibacillus halophilus TaxID=295065 RepID=A0ABN0Z6S1_9BACI
MVGHQTVGSEFKRGLLIGLLEYTKENFEITIILKKRIPAIAATDDVIE